MPLVQVVKTTGDGAFGGLPLFGCGISLGGCVLTSAAHQQPAAFAGAVLLAPMLSLEKVRSSAPHVRNNQRSFVRSFVRSLRNGYCVVSAAPLSSLSLNTVVLNSVVLIQMKADPFNAMLRPFASLLAWLVPSLPVVAIPRNTMFPLVQVRGDSTERFTESDGVVQLVSGPLSCRPTPSPYVRFATSSQEDIEQDPFMYSGGTRARTAVEYMNAVEVVRSEMSAMTFPFLCFHSRQDTMTDPEGSDHLYKYAPLPSTSTSGDVMHSSVRNRAVESVVVFWHWRSPVPAPAEENRTICVS